jgi:hypothetical protein
VSVKRLADFPRVLPQPGLNDPVCPEALATEILIMRRFRLRLDTLLIVVAIIALLLVVVLQQVQIGRMRRSLDVSAQRDAQRLKDETQLHHIIREQRDLIERHR